MHKSQIVSCVKCSHIAGSMPGRGLLSVVYENTCKHPLFFCISQGGIHPILLHYIVSSDQFDGGCTVPVISQPPRQQKLLWCTCIYDQIHRTFQQFQFFDKVESESCCDSTNWGGINNTIIIICWLLLMNTFQSSDNCSLIGLSTETSC